MMLSGLPTKATPGVAISVAGRRSPAVRERPTAGSDEGNSLRDIAAHSLTVLTNP
jgi:hypothetical protein